MGMVETGNECKILVGKPEKITRRPWITLEWIFKKMRWEGVDWIHMARIGSSDLPVTTVMNLWIPLKAGNFLTS
jgi:hypothetical protein